VGGRKRQTREEAGRMKESYRKEREEGTGKMEENKERMKE